MTVDCWQFAELGDSLRIAVLIILIPWIVVLKKPEILFGLCFFSELKQFITITISANGNGSVMV
jgi:hypothetical protein